MARSMTGFARTTADIGGEMFTVEVTSVNHKFLDASFRLPNSLAAGEPTLRSLIKDFVSRGKIHVSIRSARNQSQAAPVRLDADRALQYIEASRELTHLMRSTESLSLNTLITLDGVITSAEEETELDQTIEQLGQALGATLVQLNEMRDKEGAAMLDALTQHLEVIESLAGKVAERAPELLAAYDDKLRQRIAEINVEVGVKEERLALEVAMMADRMDVTEELVRLRAHVAHCRDILASNGPIGRDLNFLVQEMQRESNTLGAKLRDVGVGRDIIEIKTEIEKFREQLQNIE